MVRSIIDIDLRDDRFQQFIKTFNQYQRTLKSQPQLMNAIGQAIGNNTKAYKQLVAEEVAAIGKAKLLVIAQEHALNITREQASLWQRMQRTTTGVATNIRDITGSLLQWGKVTGIVSGLLGAGGLFGVTRLAQDVAGGRRNSQGIGTSYGEQKAFQTNFSRLVDPDAVLGGVNSALTNVSNRVNLYNAGLKEGDLGGGAGAVSARLLNRLKGLADATPDNLLGNVHAARGLGNLGISPEDFQRLKKMSREELGSLTAGYNRDTGSFGVGDKDQRAYQELTTQLTRAGEQIENVLVKGLAAAIPEITKLSTEVVGLVKAFSENGGLKDAVNDLRDVIRGITNFVKDPMGAVKSGVSNEFGREWGLLKNDAARLFGNNPWTLGSAKPNAGGVNVKPDAGTLAPGLKAIAEGLSSMPGFNRVTAGNDAFHKDRKSAHNEDRAFDFTIKDPTPENYAEAAKYANKWMKEHGVEGTASYHAKGQYGATADHLHVQTERKVDVNISNTPGSSIIVQTRQLVPPS